jgi:hypothetical protein
MFEPHGSADKNVVPKSTDQVEEAADFKVENGSSPGLFSASIFSTNAVPTATILFDNATHF